jgi:hypothetical protein
MTSRPLRRSSRRLLLVLAPLLPALLAPGPAHAAGWSKVTSAGPATVTMAKLSRSFVPIGPVGVAGSSFFVRNGLLGEVDTVDLVNTGSVAVALSGTATLTPLVGGTVEVASCSAAYVGTTCPAGAVAKVLGTASRSITTGGQQVVPITYASSLAVGSSLHLKLTLLGVLYNEATLTATPTAVRSATDRTAG